ncbi:aspartyl protease family protein [Phenylobacterium aquaticum]|uniref:aspartyl protease family protein n=1 Tax=Phenylobacterium aquaticum TaxID=1763816 RepID=UPI001F5DDD02|nr:aspartyl protease family protein [Phenylobacterium aquaticum]MCI3130788.1 aspartyl protease family protein [Phenylobacterium aquaticum]
MSTQAAPNSEDQWTPLLPDPDAVIVTGTVLGERVRVLIDTGSAATMVDAALAQRLGLKPAESRSVRGDIGSVTLGAGGALAFEVGGVKLATDRYFVTDFRPIFGADSGAPHLILGVDVLKDAVLDIDFPARRLAIWPRAGFQPGKDSERFAVARSARGQLFIPIVLEGKAPVDAALDLGSSNPLTVSPTLAEALGLLNGRQVSSAATGGVDGISISRTISVSTLRLGQDQLNDVPCEILAKTDATLAPAKLGLPVLERYGFALDVAGGALWLRPARRLLAAPFQRDLSGLGLALEADRLRVVHVAVGGPAALAGWREGENIIAVNGVPIGPDYVTGGLARWRYGPAGGKAVLSLSDGSERTLVLQRYY